MDSLIPLAMAIHGIVSFSVGFYMGIRKERESVRWECVKRGVAEYDKVTGEWQWKPEFQVSETPRHED